MAGELSERERITILMMRGWGDNERSYAAVVRLFNETYPNRRINKSTVLKTIERFRETGSVKNRPKSGRPLSATNEEKQLDVMQTFIEDPNSTVKPLILSRSNSRYCSQVRLENFKEKQVLSIQITICSRIARRRSGASYRFL